MNSVVFLLGATQAGSHHWKPVRRVRAVSVKTRDTFESLLILEWLVTLIF